MCWGWCWGRELKQLQLETERLWGGLWSSLDDNVPNNNHVVDIGGDVVMMEKFCVDGSGSIVDR